MSYVQYVNYNALAWPIPSSEVTPFSFLSLPPSLPPFPRSLNSVFIFLFKEVSQCLNELFWFVTQRVKVCPFQLKSKTIISKKNCFWFCLIGDLNPSLFKTVVYIIICFLNSCLLVRMSLIYISHPSL